VRFNATFVGRHAADECKATSVFAKRSPPSRRKLPRPSDASPPTSPSRATPSPYPVPAGAKQSHDRSVKDEGNNQSSKWTSEQTLRLSVDVSGPFQNQIFSMAYLHLDVFRATESVWWLFRAQNLTSNSLTMHYDTRLVIWSFSSSSLSMWDCTCTHIICIFNFLLSFLCSLYVE